EFSEEDRKHVNVTERDGSRHYTAAGNSIEFLSTENAVKRLDLAEGADPIAIDLYLDRGRSLVVKVQDADGRPLPGAIASGVTESWPITYARTKAECPIYALDPKRPRALAFYHVERKLGGALTVRGDEAGPLAVTLRPTGSVTGRVLDADGQPVAGADVN